MAYSQRPRVPRKTSRSWYLPAVLNVQPLHRRADNLTSVHPKAKPSGSSSFCCPGGYTPLSKVCLKSKLKQHKEIFVMNDENTSAGQQTSSHTSNVHLHGVAPVHVVPAGNGIAVAGFVMSLVALCLSWLPFVNFVCWVLAVVFSAVGLSKALNHSCPHKGLAIAGLVISLAPLAIMIAILAAILA